MYEDQFIRADETGLALVDERGVNDGVRPSLIILPDGDDPQEHIYAILRSDFRATLARTVLVVSMIIVGFILIMELMVGANFLSAVHPFLPVGISAVAMFVSLLLMFIAHRARPKNLLRADISLRDILTPQDVAKLRRAKSSDHKEDYLDVQEQIAVKKRRNLGVNPSNSAV